MKKKIKLPKFSQYLVNGFIVEQAEVEKLPEEAKGNLERATVLKFLIASLNTPVEGHGGLTASEIRDRSKIVDRLEAAEGESSVTLDPAQYTLLKAAFRLTPWRQRHVLFVEIDDALEAAVDADDEAKKVPEEGET